MKIEEREDGWWVTDLIVFQGVEGLEQFICGAMWRLNTMELL
jgi:hypothetical protein